MRVLQVHYIDRANSAYGGGGAVAMYRLHLNLRKAGIESKILCRNKMMKSSDSIVIPEPSRIESYLGRLTSRFGLNDIHCLSTFRVMETKDYADADILNFHCIHGGFFNYLALPSLTRSKPAVFTLHDMWPFTGHCAYSYDCDRWKTGCGKCPYPDSYPPIRRDATRIEWRFKDWIYNRSNLTIVAPSIWLTEQTRQSMLNRLPVHHIPYGIDTEVYRPLNREQCRSLLRIPSSKKILMFSALNLKDHRKGGDLLLKGLQSLPESLKAGTVLLLVGAGGEAIADAVGMQTLNLGYVDSDHLKAIAYSAADLYIHPSRADNLPLVLQESMACGTPAVSFKVGGVPDLVRSDITGYLAEPESAEDLCSGIVQLLGDESLRSYMGKQCRTIALKEYSLELQVQRYLELYRRLLEN